MNKTNDIAASFGFIATYTAKQFQSDITLTVGICTILFLIPGIITRWSVVFREIRNDKNPKQKETNDD